MNFSPVNISVGYSEPASRRTPLSATEAMRLVETWIDLPPGRRRDLRSAISVAARLCKLPTDSVPMMPSFLSERIADKIPATVGLTAQRYANVLTNVRFVLRRIGVHAHRCVLPAAWAVLRAKLDRPKQLALSALFQFLTLRDLSPDAVGAEMLADFECWCRNDILCGKPDKLVRRTVNAWNRAAESVSGWPAVRLVCPPASDHYALPLVNYPQSFIDDIERWKLRNSQTEASEIFADDIFSESSAGTTSGRPQALRHSTITARVFQIRQAAGALVRSGLCPSEITSLEALVSPRARVRTILTFMRGRGAEKRSENAGGVAEILRQIAKYHVNLPDVEVAQIKSWCDKVSPERNKGMTSRNRERLRALIQPRICAALLHLPATLFKEGCCPDRSPRRNAILMQRALALEILTVCPLRLSNLVELRLDIHLKRPDPTSARIRFISIQADEVKNESPYDWPIPPETSRLIDTWLTKFRSAIADRDNPYLFVGDRPTEALTKSAIQYGLIGTIERRIGVRINVHLMRHFAAWLYLSAFPGDYETVRRVLNHKTIGTTIGFYCGLETDSAAHRFDEVVLNARKSSLATGRAVLGRNKPRSRGTITANISSF